MEAFYTIPEVAKMVGVGEQHIYRVTRSGELGSYKIGRMVRISQAQLDQWLGGKRQYTKYERQEIAETYTAIH